MFQFDGPNGSTGFANAQAVWSMRVISPALAIVARMPNACEPGTNCFHSQELQFVVAPENLDPTFRKASCPIAADIRSAGRLTLENTPDDKALGWMVRTHADKAYISATRRVSSGSGKFILFAAPEDQPVGIEQVTFRFELDDWVEHGPDLAQGLESWMAESRDNDNDHTWFKNACAPRIKIGTSTDRPAEVELPLLAHLPLERPARTRVLSSCMLSQPNSNHGPLTALVQSLSDEQRRSATLVLGYRSRFNNADFQVFDSSGMKLSVSGTKADEKAAFTARESLRAKPPTKPTHWLDTLDSLIASPFAQLLPEPARATNLLQAMIAGAPRSMRHIAVPTLKSALALLDALTDLRLSQKQDVKELQDIHETFLHSMLVSFTRIDRQLWMEIAKHEFAPAIFARQLQSRFTAISSTAIKVLMNLRTDDPTCYLALTGRMGQDLNLHPVSWDDFLNAHAPKPIYISEPTQECRQIRVAR